MALNIKNRDVERLAEEVATLARETKTQAIRKAIEERKERLSLRVVRRDRAADLRRFLDREVWAEIPSRLLGKRLSRHEEERILGYGAKGV
jgi:antitoxin VapB